MNHEVFNQEFFTTRGTKGTKSTKGRREGKTVDDLNDHASRMRAAFHDEEFHVRDLWSRNRAENMPPKQIVT
jgi:hypothetical protein